MYELQEMTCLIESEIEILHFSKGFSSFRVFEILRESEFSLTRKASTKTHKSLEGLTMVSSVAFHCPLSFSHLVPRRCRCHQLHLRTIREPTSVFILHEGRVAMTVAACRWPPSYFNLMLIKFDVDSHY